MDPAALTKAERASAQCVPAARAGQAVAKSAGAIYSDNMGQQDFIAVDWGTTNRRAYRIRAGAVIDSVQDALGVTAVPAGGFEQEVAHHGCKARVHVALLASAHAIHGGAHVVVDASPGPPTDHR